jgi:iron complex transport system ATP-binding protein
MKLEVLGLDCGYTPKPNVEKVCFELSPGDFLCLLGPNGCGKTSLLKTLAGLLPVRGGTYRIDGIDMLHVSGKQRSRLTAFVPQSHAPVFSFSVLDVVVTGRAGLWPMWSGPQSEDWEHAWQALNVIGLESLATRPYTELSGGERQMILIARALAQGSEYLILDEPASSLDFGNQVRLLHLLQQLSVEGKGIIMTSHHPDHGLRYANQVATIRDHQFLWLGNPSTNLDAECLESIYNIPFIVNHLQSESGNAISFCTPSLI